MADGTDTWHLDERHRDTRHLDERHRDCIWALRAGSERSGTRIAPEGVAQILNRPVQWVQDNWNRVTVPTYQAPAQAWGEGAFVGSGHRLGTSSASYAAGRPLSPNQVSYAVDRPLTSNQMMPRPLMFIEQTVDGKFRVNREVVDLLQQHDTLFSCIAIVGKYRTGKSFLLNELMGCMHGFVVGHTVQTQTKGVWLWMKPHPEHPNNMLILLDTEGTADVEKSDEENDTKLLALTTLLCSTLTFNTVGVLDNTNIQQLELLTGFTEIIRTQSGKRTEDGTAFRDHFPRLVILIRDFTLKLELNDNPVTEDEYLENALVEKPGRNATLRRVNDTKDCIKNLFAERTCRVLVKPTECEADLLRLTDGEHATLKPQFLQQMHDVRALLISEGVLYTMDGYPVTTSDYVHIVNEYITALNKGTTPCIQSAAQRLKAIKREEHLQTVIKLYNETMCREAGEAMEEYQLEGIHRTARDIALHSVRSERAFENDDDAMDKLQEALNNCYAEFVKKHEQDRTNTCKGWFQACIAEVNQHIKDNHYTNHGDGFSKYEADMHNAMQTYQVITQGGPIAQQVLDENLQLREGERSAIENASRIAGEKQEQIRVAELQLQEQQARNDERQRASHNNLITELERERQTYENTLSEIHVKFIVENERMQELLKESVHKVQNLRQEGMNRMGEVENIVREMNSEARRLRESANNFG